MVKFEPASAFERDAVVIALGEALTWSLLFGSLAAKIDDDVFLQAAETQLLAAVRNRLAIDEHPIEADAGERIVSMIRDFVALAHEHVAEARRLRS